MTCARTCRRQYHHSSDDSKKNVCAGTCPRQYRPKQGLQHSLTYTTLLPWDKTHHLCRIRISTKKRQKAALHQSNDRWLRHWCTSFVPAPDIDKKTARSLHRPKAMIVTLNYIHHVTALTWNTSFVPDPYIDKKTAKSSIAPKQWSMIATLVHIVCPSSVNRQKNSKKQHCTKTMIRISTKTFSLPNVRKATAAYNDSTSERPKVLRRLQFFHIFTSKCAKSHSGVQWFNIGTSKSAPKTTVF